MRKRIMAICITLVMICSVSGSVVATAYSEEREVPVSSYQDDELDIDPVNLDEVPRVWSSSADSLETAYVSPYVTSVKNQNPYGTCWAFACIAASEASMVSEGMATLAGDDSAEVNLSELHLAYFLSHSVTDPLGGTAGDCFSITDTSTNAFLENGGNQSLVTYRVANWYGLVDETTAPYNSIVSTQAVALSDTIAYARDVAHLENAYWISMQDQDTVKRLIKQYGACAAAYCSEDAYYSTGNASTWNQKDAVAVYCPEDVSTNHGITIVGWDDNYSADNFGTNKPESDGAWYCKNSWGTDWSKDGYFWISYEDVPLKNGEAFFYDYGRADNYDKNYQYDGGAINTIYICNYEANIYTAQENEYIQAVGFYTYDSNYDCTIKVYKNCTAGKPTSGTLLATMDADQLYAGFHTVELKEPYLLNKGERFSVVVYQKAKDGESTFITADCNYSVSGKWCSNTSAANAGESFLSIGGTSWTDISSEGNNCRIKAYTDVRVPVTDLTLNKTELTLYKDEMESIDVKVAPDNATKKSVTWKSSDASVVTVDEDGVLTAKKAGEATITCISDDDNTVQSECDVEVKQWVESVSLAATSYNMLEQEEKLLDVTVTPTDASDQTVQWTSDNEKVATVSGTGKVTAVGYGKATITCTASDRNVCSAACEINVYEKITDLSLAETEELYVGECTYLDVSVTPDLTKTMGVTWSTSDSDVATVDKDGRVTAIKAGSTVITCVSNDNEELLAQCQLTVKKGVEAVRVDWKSKEMAKGETLQLHATVSPSDATDKTVQWTSSDNKVATVSDTGEVTAMGYGTATITCTATDRGTGVATTTISVYEKVTSITLNNSSVLLKEGDTLQLVSTVTPEVSRTKGIYWISSDETIAKVDANGRLTAVAQGGPVTVKCIAKDGTGVIAVCTVTVNKKVILRKKGTQFNDTATNITYKVTEGGSTNATVQFADGKSCTGVVTIPDTVERDGVVYQVTSIGENAFKKNTKITQVVIGNHITSIGKNAFYNCKNLKNVSLGKNVVTIGDKAFYQCSRLSKIVIPSKVSKIGKQAFYKCKKLKNITIKTSSLTKKKVGKNAFKGIHAKATIKVPKKKLSSYKKVLKARGIGSRVKVKKY